MTVGMDDGPKGSAPWKNVASKLLSAVLVAVLGFVLLNLAFLVYAAFQDAIYTLIYGAGKWETQELVRFDPIYLGWAFLAIMAGAFWLVYRSRLHVVFKAAFLMVPFATLLVLVGMKFYLVPLTAYAIGAVAGAILLLLLYRRKEHWLYAFSALLVMAALLIMGLLGVDI
ncbi:MAG: hypothetical protein KBB09_00385 [Firmicutes bacterium]|nr:hypothetical protein [Bacillota bacterium]